MSALVGLALLGRERVTMCRVNAELVTPWTPRPVRIAESHTPFSRHLFSLTLAAGASEAADIQGDISETRTALPMDTHVHVFYVCSMYMCVCWHVCTNQPAWWSSVHF